MDLNDRIAECRRQGLSKAETVKDFITSHGLTLEQANWLVHASPVWADVRARDEAFQDAFFGTLAAEK